MYTDRRKNEREREREREKEREPARERGCARKIESERERATKRERKRERERERERETHTHTQSERARERETQKFSTGVTRRKGGTWARRAKAQARAPRKSFRLDNLWSSENPASSNDCTTASSSMPLVVAVASHDSHQKSAMTHSKQCHDSCIFVT